MFEVVPVEVVPVEDDAESPHAVVAVVDDQPNEKPKRLRLWIVPFLAIVVVAVSIAIPISGIMQNGTAESEPTPEPLAPERLTALIQSRLSSVSFDNTSPESRALIWMTEVDTYSRATLSEDRLVQRFAMAAIGMSINNFPSWLTGSTECSWGSGRVTCNSLGEVVSIVAYEDSLSGSIPVSTGLLTNIELFRLSNNQFTGTIPSEVGSLTALTQLGLSGNTLTGSIPSEVGGLTALTKLDLYSNALTGTIPTEVEGLTALTYLGLSGNTLTGMIPSEVGGLAALTWVGLHDNALTGMIPSEVAGLAALKWLSLYVNQLTGTMPDGVCEVVSPRIDCDEIVCDCCESLFSVPCP